MAFCTNCGTQLSDGTAFCSNCGTQLGAAPAVMATATPETYSGPPLDYTIEGDNLEVVRVKLKAGQELIAEAGKMVYKTPSVEWETKMPARESAPNSSAP